MSLEGAEGTTESAGAASAESSAPAAESTNTVTTDGDGDVPVQVSGGAKAIPPAQPAWTPNYKFKVKGKEQEVDEWIRPSIKDPDTEKKARELMEKYYGFDMIKSDREKFQQERDSFKSDAEKMYGLMNDAAELVSKKDYETFFEKWGIPAQDIVKYAVDWANREQNWTPEQKKAYEESRRLKAELAQTQAEKMGLETSQTQQQIAQRESELEAVVNHPEVTEFSKLVAERLGDEFGLRNEIVRLGQYYWQTQGRDVPTVELVRDLAKRYGYTPGASQPQQTPVQPQAAQGFQVTPPKVVAPSTKPTIPNIAGKGGSPVAKKPKSFSDLKAIRQGMQEAGIE